MINLLKNNLRGASSTWNTRFLNPLLKTYDASVRAGVFPPPPQHTPSVLSTGDSYNILRGWFLFFFTHTHTKPWKNLLQEVTNTPKWHFIKNVFPWKADRAKSHAFTWQKKWYSRQCVKLRSIKIYFAMDMSSILTWKIKRQRNFTCALIASKLKFQWNFHFS